MIKVANHLKKLVFKKIQIDFKEIFEKSLC